MLSSTVFVVQMFEGGCLCMQPSVIGVSTIVSLHSTVAPQSVRWSGLYLGKSWLCISASTGIRIGALPIKNLARPMQSRCALCEYAL